MTGETTTLPTIKQIPAPLKGRDFLVSSHFKIGNDKRLPKSATRKSTFAKDYAAHGHYGRGAAANPPAPAQVMHRDEAEKIRDTTETQASFQGSILPRVPRCIALTKTNFKMDADERVDSFHTTNTSHYTLKPLSKSLPIDNPMKSYVPQGDPIKERMPLSDYAENFLGIDTNTFKVLKAPCMHTGGPKTINGDDRTHTQFSTSNNDHFPGRYLPYVAVKPDLLGSHIPKGDPVKLVHRDTTQRISYPRPGSCNYTGYHRDHALLRISNTNFKMGHSNKYNKFETTASACYSAKIKPVLNKVIPYDSNASSFPEGDRHPDRVKELVSTTNYGVYYNDFPSSFRNTIISGANKRTKSRVTFGEPRQANVFYSTTQTDSYPVCKVPVVRADGHPESKVPLDYYGNGKDGDPTVSTTRSDFPSWEGTPRHKVTKDALVQLRKSSWSPPLQKERFFDTTNLTSYCAKQVTRHQYDSGRLQRSSVPIGTLTI